MPENSFFQDPSSYRSFSTIALGAQRLSRPKFDRAGKYHDVSEFFATECQYVRMHLGRFATKTFYYFVLPDAVVSEGVLIVESVAFRCILSPDAIGNDSETVIPHLPKIRVHKHPGLTIVYSGTVCRKGYHTLCCNICASGCWRVMTFENAF